MTQGPTAEQKPELISLTRTRGRIRLRLTALALGRDLSVTLAGGDREHIGAVALSQARPSLERGGGTSATTSVLALCGHKEDDLARALASRLAAQLEATVCVACGIHVEAIQTGELQEVAEMAEELLAELLQRLDPKQGQANRQRC